MHAWPFYVPWMLPIGCFEFRKALGLCGGRDEDSDGVVTVLQANGKVLEFLSSVKCSEVLASHPDHRLCLASALLEHGPQKMLPNEAALERGQVYALVPKPVPGRALVKFLISKEHLATIRGEQAVTAGGKPAKQEKVALTAPKAVVTIKRGGSRGHDKRNSWSAPLDTISESADHD